MLLIAFICFAVLLGAWLFAPVEPRALSSMLRTNAPDSIPGDVELQH